LRCHIKVGTAADVKKLIKYNLEDKLDHLGVFQNSSNKNQQQSSLTNNRHKNRAKDVQR